METAENRKITQEGDSVWVAFLLSTLIFSTCLKDYFCYRRIDSKNFEKLWRTKYRRTYYKSGKLRSAVNTTELLLVNVVIIRQKVPKDSPLSRKPIYVSKLYSKSEPYFTIWRQFLQGLFGRIFLDGIH